MSTKSTGCKQRKFSDKSYRLKTLIHIIYTFYADKEL